MRYFRYKNIDKNLNNALEEQYKTLNNCEKRIFRKKKIWQKISTVVSLFIYVTAVTLGIYLLKSISQPSGWLLKLVVGIAKVIAGFTILIVSGILTVGLTMPLWKKVESFHLPIMKKEIFSKACSHLRDFYEIKEPYIITKCFEATDNKFQNHDVCIFVVDDELRITTDLIRGFLHGERDLGCYAFNEHEIKLTKRQFGKQLMAEMNAGKTTFLLGYRAKSFIEKNFTSKEND